MATTTKKPAEELEVKNDYDPWKDMRDVFLPRQSAGNEPTMFVGVNGRTFLLPYGKKSTVPMPVYEVIMQKFEAENILAEVEASVPNKG